MTKNELIVEIAMLQDIVEKLRGMSTRYLWLREYATGMQMDELADMDSDEWDAYIDKAMNRQ